MSFGIEGISGLDDIVYNPLKGLPPCDMSNAATAQLFSASQAPMQQLSQNQAPFQQLANFSNQGGTSSRVVNIAGNTVGQNNSDGGFSFGNHDEASQKYWCADYACSMWARACGGEAPWARDNRGNNRLGTDGIARWASKKGVYSKREELMANGFGNVKPGDILIFGRKGQMGLVGDSAKFNSMVDYSQKARNHAAIVESIDYQNGTITTIEGNSFDHQVRRLTYSLKDMETLDGIARMSAYSG